MSRYSSLMKSPISAEQKKYAMFYKDWSELKYNINARAFPWLGALWLFLLHLTVAGGHRQGIKEMGCKIKITRRIKFACTIEIAR